MTGNTESPNYSPEMARTVTGSAVFARSWYGQARSAFSKARFTPMRATREQATISHPSQSISSQLGTIPSLRFATPARLHELADVTELEPVDVGETVITQGEDGDDVFFIVDGTYHVLISHFGHEPDFIRELGAGDSFGELGVLYGVPRTATVRCTRAGHVLRMPGQSFLDALDTGS